MTSSIYRHFLLHYPKTPEAHLFEEIRKLFYILLNDAFLIFSNVCLLCRFFSITFLLVAKLKIIFPVV